MPIRPEARQRLEAGFQRRVSEQRQRYATQWAEAEHLAVGLEYGDVVGIFGVNTGGEIPFRAYLRGLAPLLAIPVLIAAAAERVAWAVPLLGALPFFTGAWFGAMLLLGRRPKRRVWLYTFSEGFCAPDSSAPGPISARWEQVERVREVRTNEFNASSEESEPTLTGYELELGDGRRFLISRSYRNMMDPYAPVGRMVAGLTPPSVAEVIPRFPVIDEIIGTYVVRRHAAIAYADFRTGRAIESNGITLSQGGIGRVGDAASIPWGEVDHVKIQEGRLLVYRHGSRAPVRYALSEPADVTVLPPLLRELGVLRG